MIWILCINSEFHRPTIECNDLFIIENKNNYGLNLEGFSDHASSFDS